MTSPHSVRTDLRLPPEPATDARSGVPVSSGSVAARVLLPLYLLAVAAAVLIPDPHAVGTFKYNLGFPLQQLGGLSAQVSATLIGDILGNVAGFIPLTVLLCLGWRGVPGWVWGAVGCLLSVAAEAAQFLLPELSRRPDLWNIVENSAGGWIGVGLVTLPRRGRARRRGSPR